MDTQRYDQSTRLQGELSGVYLVAIDNIDNYTQLALVGTVINKCHTTNFHETFKRLEHNIDTR